MARGIIEAELLRMKVAEERMEEIFMALKSAMKELEDSTAKMNLSWDSEANSTFMSTIGDDAMQMNMMLSYVWDAVKSLNTIHKNYQIAEREVGEYVSCK